MSARAVTGTLGVFRRALDVAVRDGVIPAKPATGVRRPTAKRTADLWTADDLATFREATEEDPLAGATGLVLCGLRRSEVLGLEWADVHPEEGTVRVGQGRVALSDGSTDTDRRAEVQRERPHGGRGGSAAGNARLARGAR